MKNITSILILMSMNASFLSAQTQNAGKLVYPQTRKTETTDQYFGKNVADPYRWLEDDRSPETEAWVKEQNKVTSSYLANIPLREKIKSRLTELWNFTRYSSPQKEGKFYTFYKNDGIQNHSVLFIQEGLDGTPRVLLDPNTMSKDGTTSLGGYKFSKDHKYMAYILNKAGSDWSEIHFRLSATGEDLPDVIKWVKFSDLAWNGDGIYYSAYSEPQKGKEFSSKNENHKVYFHQIGKSQQNDELIYEDAAHPLRNYAANVTEDGEYLLIYGSESTSGTTLIAKNLKQPNAEWINLSDNFNFNFTVVHHQNGILYVVTDQNAPRYCLMSADLKSGKPVWKTVIPESTDLLESVNMAGGKFLALYLKDVRSKLLLVNINGQTENEIPLSGLVKVENISCDKDDPLFFYTANTFTAPATVVKMNLETQKSEIWYQPKMNFKSEDYETVQVFYPSKDGTKIPMFLTYKKGIKMEGKNPCFIFGYGGFNSYYAPEFRIDRAVFLEMGGIYAVPGLRGGGEYGEDWHKAGVKCNKQNVFDDFIAAAEFLVKEKYTSFDKIAIHGRSNGGLLIGAVMTQRPDICKVAIPTVGVMDMLRYHKFTIGWAWASDYGTSENQEEFNCLIKYSPVHNVRPAQYPATLVTTGDHDDRVVPAHSFKFISALQESQKGDLPVLIRIDVNAGHGAGKPTAKQIEEFTDIWSFVCYNLGMK